MPGENGAKRSTQSFEVMRFSIDLSLTKLGSSHRRVDSSGVLQAPGTRGFTYGEIHWDRRSRFRHSKGDLLCSAAVHGQADHGLHVTSIIVKMFHSSYLTLLGVE